ncbi:MAG: UDP-N-acetylmuramoyl-L-alanine--D-glutamate ligase, partial [Actinobacteria bacterium]|nr:UDP-N-acetylmuramoyl-L-alanine--D-glutamate ligase [Actinomycetota bacterium]
MRSALVVGMGVTGEAVARHLRARDVRVTVVEDNPGAGTDERMARLPEGVELVRAPDADALRALVVAADLVVPSPGVPNAHPVYELAAAADVPVVNEIELAARATTVPIVAVTGTNGKTTVTTLVTDMLEASGRRAVAAGNIGLPLVEAVESDAEVIVAEVSSFQLQHTDTFHPQVAVWLNVTADHLDWHPTFEHYAAAKERIWRNQAGDDVAVANAEDEAVMNAARAARGRVQTFGIDAGDWHVENGALTTPTGETIVPVAHLPRSLPHDIANDLAAVAASVAAGADLDACRAVLKNFAGLPHRVELVSDAGGVKYYDDSKATTPASVVAAARGFESVVLIAGGKNKGLSLAPLAETADHVRAVVAIGDASGEVEAAFAGVRPVTRAASMRDAVRAARRLAQAGDVVLLSPG